MSFGLDKICVRSKETEAGTATRKVAGAGTEAGARAGAGFDLMKCHLAVLKPRLMIDIIIWS